MIDQKGVIRLSQIEQIDLLLQWPMHQSRDPYLHLIERCQDQQNQMPGFRPCETVFCQVFSALKTH